jgi:hypothetical protein
VTDVDMEQRVHAWSVYEYDRANEFKPQSISLFKAIQLDIVTKKRGEFAKCILQEEVSRVLYNAHDLHGHLTLRIALRRFLERYHWPTRVEDVKELGGHLGILVGKYYICNESSYIPSCVSLIRLSRRLSIYLSLYGNSI